MTEEGGERASR